FFSMEFFNGDKLLTKSANRSSAYYKEEGGQFLSNEGIETFMRDQLSLSVGEAVYGLGERFTPFVKNGQSIDCWNEDGGTSTEQSYKNVPFYITNKGYGVFVNHPERVSFEVGSELVTKVQFSVPGETLDYFIITGDDMKEVLENYTSLTGKPALPPAWSFGLWLTTSFTTNYDEETVTQFVDGMAERDIPLHVFHFDCFWMKGFNWCNFEWDNEVFPDPKAMLERLKAKGLKICVWINPYIAQESSLFEEGRDNGYFIKRPNGDVWQWDMWQPGMAIVDFTNPEACKWYADKLRDLMEMGVDCFKTDFGERIPVECTYFDGSDPVKMHNYYTQMYNKVVFDVVKEVKGENEAVLFARSATAGGQQFPVHWGGDCTSEYESMAESLRGGLSLCLSGFGFWSHDIGGFESTSTPDVYKRWAAFGLLSSHSRLHGSTSYRVPWLYDEESCEVVKFFTNLKCSIMPYLFKTANDAATKGIPTMRAMILENQNDPACRYLDRQYMLGDSILVAPIFNEDGIAEYYLPHGTWTNFITGEKHEGGRWKTEKLSLIHIS
ncbi:MAG: alpha-xylosidase, partial [Clostridium celatum]|nr:alpha-xylosidase [Clostridium celatum]